MNEEYLTRKEVASYLKIGLNSADKIIKNNPNTKILYVTSEQFINSCN